MIKLSTSGQIFLRAILVIGTLYSGQVMSAVVWTQLPLQGSKVTNLDITYFAIADDFELVANTSLTGFTVFLADRAQSSLIDGNLDNFSGTLGWAIYSNFGNAPGMLLHSGSDTSPKILGSGSLVGTREMFQVDVNLGSAIDLLRGVYWISIRDGQWGGVSDLSIVGWVQSSQTSLSSAVFEENIEAPTAWANLGVDLALIMNAKVVPEPSLMAILITTLAMVVTRRHRRQSMAS